MIKGSELYLGKHFGVDIVLIPPTLEWKSEPVRYDVHPIIHWLAKYLPIDPWIDGVRRWQEEVDRQAYMYERTMYMTPKQWDELRKLANQRIDLTCGI